MKCAKFVGSSFSQNTTGRLLMIIAVSIAVKRELTNKTVNYATKTLNPWKTKAYVPLWAGSVIKKCTPGQRSGFRNSPLQTPNNLFLKISKDFKKVFFSVKFAKFLRTPYFTEQLQCLLLTCNSLFPKESGTKTGGLSAINTKFSWKKVFIAAESRSSCCRCSVKKTLQLY